MGALAGVADAISSELTLILSLFIPFVGIVVPAVVILAVSTPSRTRRPAMAATFTAPTPAPAHPAPAFRASRAAVPAQEDLSWACQRLRESEIFGGLTDRELRLVAGLGERRHVAAGERLAHAGSRGDHLFLILSGEFRLLSHGTEEIPVRMAHPGEVVPLAVIIDPPVLVTTLEAITDGEVFSLPRMRLLELFDLQPTIGLQVYRAASKSFESRYRKSLDGLVGALHVAMHPNEERLPSRAEARSPQPEQ
ncbi:MAG TPA: cyclic nucleotide-binding domain-containing protein [Dehalococcoidia bacterium]|nr:cyclic nucleotide-binding domain-containing protein [Dehalococcoidia bacterium]